MLWMPRKSAKVLSGRNVWLSTARSRAGTARHVQVQKNWLIIILIATICTAFIMYSMYSWSSWAYRSTTFFNFCSVIKSREVFMRAVSKFPTKISLDQKLICFISICYFVKGICLKSNVLFLNKKQSPVCQKILFWLKCKNLKLKNMDLKILTFNSCCLNALCLCCTCGLSLAAKWLGS